MASDEELFEVKEKFFAKVSQFLCLKRADNNAFLTADKYEAVIRQVKEGKVKKKKEAQDYRRLKRYDVFVVGGQEKLIQPMTKTTKKIRYYVKNEELFDIIHSSHLAIGHGGRNRMMHELKPKYCNVTQETVMAYLSLCKHCQNKQQNVTKKLERLVSNPVLSNRHLNSRCQIDFIDMESSQLPCSEHKFVLVYHDQPTKFVILRAAKSDRCAKEVADHLVDIFTTLGAPMIVQTEHGREFADLLVEQIAVLWKDVKVVASYDRRNSHRPGGGMGLKRTSREIVDMLVAWMKDNHRTDWESGLRFVQFMKNRAFHEGIKRSPFEAMFGCEVKFGLDSSSLPRELLENIKTEKDFVCALGENVTDVA